METLAARRKRERHIHEDNAGLSWHDGRFIAEAYGTKGLTGRMETELHARALLDDFQRFHLSPTNESHAGSGFASAGKLFVLSRGGSLAWPSFPFAATN